MLRTIKTRERERKRERERERERKRVLWRLKETHIISFGITRYNAQRMCPVY